MDNILFIFNGLINFIEDDFLLRNGIFIFLFVVKVLMCVLVVVVFLVGNIIVVFVVFMIKKM